MFDTGLLHTQTHIPRGPSGSVSRMAVGTGGGTVGVAVGAMKKSLHMISVYMHACKAYAYSTFFVLLCCQSFFGKEDSEIIVGAFHPKKLYLANCIVMCSIR